MAGKKYQSCLVPFEDEILALRGTSPPTPYSKIVEYLKDKHKISVRHVTIYSFLKTRAKGYKPCRFTESIKQAKAANQPTTETPSLSKPTVSEIRETQKQSVAVKPAATSAEPKKILNMKWSDVYNLTRMSDEEAAARNKRIEEKRKRLMEEQLKKENQ